MARQMHGKVETGVERKTEKNRTEQKATDQEDEGKSMDRQS